MADSIIITTEDIANAKTYIPLSAKEGFARNIAPLCMEPVEVRIGIENEFSLPNRVRENRKLLAQYKMGFLAYYLNKEFKKQTAMLQDGSEIDLELCMDENEYDIWAGSHVFNQLERLKKAKGDEKTSNRIFDLLYDYKAMETMLTLAVRDEAETRNDAFDRAAEFIIQTMTEDAMKEMMAKSRADVESVTQDLEAYAAERQEGKNG